LEEERELEELRKLRAQFTGVKNLERVEFMYQTPSVVANVSSQQYLEGYRYKEPKEDTDVQKLRNKPGSLWLDAPRDSKLDKLAKIKEDPLFSIRQEIQKNMDTLKDNPIKMKQIREEIERRKVKKLEKKSKKT